MRKLLVDTSVTIEFVRLKDKSETPIVKLAQRDFQLSVSIITYFEMYAGKSVWEKDKAKTDVERLLAGMEVLGLDTDIAQKAGELKARFGLSTMDALIAATAVQNHLPLLTFNLKDFERVPGLELFADAVEEDSL